MIFRLGQIPIFFKQPDEKTLFHHLNGQGRENFSYPGVGFSKNFRFPLGYRVLQSEIQLGYGIEVFERAKRAIQNWEIFPSSWTRVWGAKTPVEGAVVGVLVKAFGFWFLNACRLVFVIGGDDSPENFGFAYGTLPAHVERGEELFLVERNPKDDSVRYRIFSFSRPSGALYRLANPCLKALQRRFIFCSLAAMQRAVARGMVQ